MFHLSAMNIPPSLSYTIRRLALFAATLLFASVMLRGVDPIIILAVATIVSGILSFFVLSGPRKEMARSVEARMKGLNQRINDGAAAEDAALDAAERARAQAPQDPAEASRPAGSPGGNQGESSEDATRRESRS